MSYLFTVATTLMIDYSHNMLLYLCSNTQSSLRKPWIDLHKEKLRFLYAQI